MAEVRLNAATQALSAFAAHSPLSAVPPGTLLRLKECVLDFVGNTAFAAKHAESSPFFRAGVLEMLGSDGAATVVGEHRTYPFMYAALLNGAYAHTLDFDDTNLYGCLHPGAPVIPAALAEAERIECTGAQLLEALVVGNEVACRVGAALGRTTFDRGFHPTAIAGIYGAAAASGRLRRLSADKIANAFGLAGSKAAGSMQYLENGSWNKRLHPGFAAHDGLMVVALAHAGVLGACAPLEGLYGTLCGYSNAPDATLLTERLGERWVISETALKPYPSCRYTHAAIDAALALRERFTQDERTSAQLHLRLSAKAMQIVGGSVPQKVRARNTVDGQFSVFFQTAIAWLDGRPNWRSYERLGDSDVEMLTTRITTEEDTSQANAGARLSVRCGAKEAAIQFDEPMGEESRPFIGDDLRRKYDDQTVPIYGALRSGEIASRTMSLEAESSARNWVSLLRTEAPQ